MSPAEAKYREAHAAWERAIAANTGGSDRRTVYASNEARKGERISRAYQRMDAARDAWAKEKRERRTA